MAGDHRASGRCSHRLCPLDQLLVGRLEPGTEFHPNPAEIAEVIEVPLAALLEPARQRVERRFIRGAERDIYFFEYAGHTIWGATARIVRNLLDLSADLPAWKDLLRP